MSAIKTVEQCFSDVAAIIERSCTDPVLNELIKEFKKNKSPLDIGNLDFLDDIPKGKGIYFFEIKFPDSAGCLSDAIRHFELSWAEWKQEKEGAAPNFQSTRADLIAESKNINEWIPLYIGKRKNIQHRLREHVEGPTNNGTSALRLNDRFNELKPYRFRFSYVTFDLNNDEYRLMGGLESKLRKKLHPILGKQ